jgi:signal peptidase II
LSPTLRGVRLALLVCAGVVALDQVAKAIVRAEVGRGDEVSVLPFLEIANTRNRGVAFGLADGASPLLIGATVAVVVVIFAFLISQLRGRAIWLAGALLVGGALGNLADRVRDGAVTDFIDLPLWPTFNLADLAIVAGVLTLILTHDGAGERSADERGP